MDIYIDNNYRPEHIQPATSSYDNSDMFTLTELYDAIALAQDVTLTTLASNSVVCDVDTVADEYPE